mmetsp:Transcript_2485/g.6193  ORF Transcript_2485/g.6193 Transcript_2485/m.6193 type:complete len:215 (+) Transcript_2485:1458-2102(+)
MSSSPSSVSEISTTGLPSASSCTAAVAAGPCSVSSNWLTGTPVAVPSPLTPAPTTVHGPIPADCRTDLCKACMSLEQTNSGWPRTHSSPKLTMYDSSAFPARPISTEAGDTRRARLSISSSSARATKSSPDAATDSHRASPQFFSAFMRDQRPDARHIASPLDASAPDSRASLSVSATSSADIASTSIASIMPRKCLSSAMSRCSASRAAYPSS